MTMSTPTPRPVEKKPMSPVVPLLGGLLFGGAAVYMFLPKEAHAGEKQIEGDKVKDGEKAGPFLKKGDKVAFIGDLSGTVISDVYHASYGGSETGGTVDVGGPVNGQLVPDWDWTTPGATEPENPTPGDFALLVDVMTDSSPFIAAKPSVIILSFLGAKDDAGVAKLAASLAKKVPSAKQLWLFEGSPLSEENRKALMEAKAAWVDGLSAYRDGAEASALLYGGKSYFVRADQVAFTTSVPVDQSAKVAIGSILGVPPESVPDSFSVVPNLVPATGFLADVVSTDRVVAGIYNLMVG